ncbi:MAG: hypothetical protein L0387_03930, partial [Acidobacteria bacterium]|nr:hypothetical protein [Acidobacteriota bacterium]
ISIELAGGAMVALVAFVAIARAIGSGLIKLAFRVALPIAGLAVLIAWESGGNARAVQELATAIAALFIMLLGFYVMFRGVFRRKK